MPAFIETRQDVANAVSLAGAWTAQIAATHNLQSDLRREQFAWKSTENRLSDLFNRLRARLA
ncbi:MAG: hypothetical protein R3C18_10280 [Planctomycetaceae bacterium]